MLQIKNRSSRWLVSGLVWQNKALVRMTVEERICPQSLSMTLVANVSFLEIERILYACLILYLVSQDGIPGLMFN